MAPCFMSISIIVTATDLQGHPSRTIIFQTIDHMFPGFDGMGPFPGNQSPTASSIFLRTSCLRTGLLLLLLPQSKQTDTRDLDDLETNTGNITLGLALTTETSKENLVVLVDEVQATVVGDCRDRRVSIWTRITAVFLFLLHASPSKADPGLPQSVVPSIK